jgi:Metallo-beta-lactamase superfamily
MQRQGLGEAISFTTHEGRYILVDAGEKGSALHEKLRRPVDVLLMTHNDQDHVGGAPELLRSGWVLQVWLPFDWYLLYSAGANLVGALRRGDADLAAVARHARTQVSEAVERLREHLVSQEPIDEPIDEHFLPRRILWQLDEAFDSLQSQVGVEIVGRAGNALGASWIGSASASAGGVTSNGSRGSPVTRARATVRVVDAVLWWAGPTRWFSIDHASASTSPTSPPWKRSGIPAQFTIVNALPVQVRPLPPPPTVADAYALFVVAYALTIQNRRALVALGHSQHRCGHVLLASDSSFEFDRVADPVVPWPMIGAAVGLHHGSADKVHDYIYERFEGAVLARSGSRRVDTNSSFSRMAPERRGCTWCHADGSRIGGLDRHRDVVLEASPDDDWRVIAGACTDCPRFA